VRRCPRIEDATVLATTHWETGEQRGGEGSAALIRRARLYRTWGDCFGYLLVASGRADVMLDPRLDKPWDRLPLLPILEGAGVRATGWSGEDPVTADALVAAAPALHGLVLELLASTE